MHTIDSGGPSVVPFPIVPRPRPWEPREPGPLGSIFERDNYDQCFVSLKVAELFVADGQGRPLAAMVREVMHDDDGREAGALCIARILEHNRHAIDFLREALVYLEGADRQVSEAAHVVLREMGAA